MGNANQDSLLSEVARREGYGAVASDFVRRDPAEITKYDNVTWADADPLTPAIVTRVKASAPALHWHPENACGRARESAIHCLSAAALEGIRATLPVGVLVRREGTYVYHLTHEIDNVDKRVEKDHYSVTFRDRSDLERWALRPEDAC